MMEDSVAADQTEDGLSCSSFTMAQAVVLTEEEIRYRQDAYPDPCIIEKLRLTCTVCQADIKREILFECEVHCHVHLGVILCKRCLDFYGTGDFSIDEDGLDKYCRWCGQGGILYICNQCPAAFCKKCIKQNISLIYWNDLKREDWKCYLCLPKPLYEQRALCWAVQTYLKKLSSSLLSPPKKQVDKNNIDELSAGIDSMDWDDESLGNNAEVEAQIVVARNWLKTMGIDLKQFSENLSDKTDRIVENNFVRCKMKKPADVDRYMGSFIATIDGSIEQLSKLRHTTTEYMNQWKVTFAETVKRERQRLHTEQEDNRRKKGTGIRNDDEVVTIDTDENKEESCLNVSFDSILESSLDNKKVSCDQGTIENNKRKEVATTDDNRKEEIEDDSAKGKEETENNWTDAEQTENKPLLRVRNVDELNKVISENSSGDIFDMDDQQSDNVSDDRNAVENDNAVEGEGGKRDTTPSPCSSGKTDDGRSKADVKKGSVKKKCDKAASSSNASGHQKAGQIGDLTQTGTDECETATANQNETEQATVNPACEEDELEALKQSLLLHPSDNSHLETQMDQMHSELAASMPHEVIHEAEEGERTKTDGTNEQVAQNVNHIDNETLKRSLMKTSSEESASEASNDRPSKTQGESRLKDTKKKMNLSTTKEKEKKASAKKKNGKSGLLESSSEDDIARLLDTSSLKKRPRRQSGNRSSGSDPNSNGSSCADRKKKKLKTKSDKKKDVSVLDFLGPNDSDENGNNMSGSSLDLAREINKLKSLSEKPCSYEDISKEIFLASTPDLNIGDSDSDDILEKSKDEEKKKGKSSKIKKEEDAPDKDKDDVFKDKSAGKWRRNKLLMEKLSSTDSSEAEEKFSEFKKKRDSKKNEPSDSNKKGAKKKRKKIFLSDSDSSYKNDDAQSSDSSSSDDSEKKDREPVQKKKMKRIRRVASDDSDSDGDTETKVTDSAGKGRKNIRKLLKEDSLEQSTQAALKEEQERKKRILERQKLYNQMIQRGSEKDEKVKETILEKLVLDFDPETKKELVSVNEDLVKKMKPHQADGIKFMWDACFESLKDAKESKGSGCIIAHCMGLGKSFQVVTLVHTLLMHPKVGVKNVLVVCPLSTVLNWVNEFEKWLKDVGTGEDIDVYNLIKVLANDRQYQIKDWFKRGGVMVLGYNMYRQLTNPKARLKKAAKAIFQESLVDPGPDLVICDEGHILKNESTALSKAMNQLKTRRRIVLTGTPLQNNLEEYHCMVQFVKPNLLGTKKEFKNRFVNPIQNGQFEDSTAHDVKVMKRRAHVLHKLLDGIVQRKDYNVLTPFLPQKYEYVISINMSKVQCLLYQHYLDNFSRGKDHGKTSATLFKDWLFLTRICTHPRLILMHSEKEQLKNDASDEDSEGSLKDFIDDGSDSGASSDSGSKSGSGSEGNNHQVTTRSTRSNPVLEEPPEVEPKKLWWNEIASEDQLEDIATGPKIVLLLSILKKCEEIGDKLLVFSQSLYTLDLIEYFLGRIDEATQSGKTPPASLGGWTGSWAKGLDYFRLDGQTASEYRTSFINRFNNLDNTRARLFLISTKAGGLGINLVGANRVIIFDASWNPSFDVQSIFRIYRFGQKKPCYVYRFLAQGTIEERIYERQVAKLSISCRVVDEQQVDRHFSHSDLTELYTFKPSQGPSATPILPKDRLMAEMLQSHADIICTYHHHDSLLENQEEEELNEEERQQAWADFENEKHAPPPPPPPLQNMTHHLLQQDYMGQELYTNIAMKIKEKNPTMTNEEIQQSTNAVLAQWRVSFQNSLQQQANLVQQQQQMMFNNGQGNSGRQNQMPRYPLYQQMMTNEQRFANANMIRAQQQQQQQQHHSYTLQSKLPPSMRQAMPPGIPNLVPNPKAIKRNIGGSSTPEALQQLLTNNIRQQDSLEVHEIDE